MRTTLTIDDDVAALLEAERQRTGLSLKEVVNKTLRRELGRKAFEVKPVALGIGKLLKSDNFNELLETLEGPDHR